MALPPIDEQAFLLGFARTAKPVDAAALTQLALLGQQRRFERPLLGPEALQPIGMADDPRPILPEAARKLFLRLFADTPKSQSDRLEAAAIAALAAAGRRLHPFDFAELEPLVLRHRGALGPAAASWAAMVRPRAADDDETETDLAVVLRAKRETDPDAARAELEPLFAGYSAKQRLALLGALKVGLGPRDVAFLSGLDGDKAGSVRDEAAELLGRIPGTANYGARLGRARDHLKLQSTGLVFKKKSLAVTGITEKSGSLWQLLAGLRIDDLAEALGLNGRTLVELAAETPDISEVMLHAVLAERRFELLNPFEAGLREDGVAWIMLLDRLLPGFAGAERERLLDVCLNPGKWTKLPMGALATLHAAWGGPLPVAVAQRFLRSEAWKTLLEATDEKASPLARDIPEQLAALVPLALSQTFIADAEPVSARAANYHRFLLALAEESP